MVNGSREEKINILKELQTEFEDSRVLNKPIDSSNVPMRTVYKKINKLLFTGKNSYLQLLRDGQTDPLDGNSDALDGMDDEIQDATRIAQKVEDALRQQGSWFFDPIPRDIRKELQSSINGILNTGVTNDLSPLVRVAYVVTLCFVFSLFLADMTLAKETPVPDEYMHEEMEEITQQLEENGVNAASSLKNNHQLNVDKLLPTEVKDLQKLNGRLINRWLSESGMLNEDLWADCLKHEPKRCAAKLQQHLRSNLEGFTIEYGVISEDQVMIGDDVRSDYKEMREIPGRAVESLKTKVQVISKKTESDAAKAESGSRYWRTYYTLNLGLTREENLVLTLTRLAYEDTESKGRTESEYTKIVMVLK